MEESGNKTVKGVDWWLTAIALMLMIPGGILMLMMSGLGEVPWYFCLIALIAVEVVGLMFLWMAKILTVLSEISEKLGKK